MNGSVKGPCNGVYSSYSFSHSIPYLDCIDKSNFIFLENSNIIANKHKTSEKKTGSVLWISKNKFL